MSVFWLSDPCFYVSLEENAKAKGLMPEGA
jgi:hypothetical protein